jgi:hypothetical protein
MRCCSSSCPWRHNAASCFWILKRDTVLILQIIYLNLCIMILPIHKHNVFHSLYHLCLTKNVNNFHAKVSCVWTRSYLREFAGFCPKNMTSVFVPQFGKVYFVKQSLGQWKLHSSSSNLKVTLPRLYKPKLYPDLSHINSIHVFTLHI